jgi:hypothetical protein
VRELAAAYAPPAEEGRPTATTVPLPPPPARTSRARRRRWLPAAIVAACLLIAGLVVALSSGGGGSHKTPLREPVPRPAPPPPATGASTPTAVVSSFYTLAARREYSAAWALTTPALRDELRGFDGFRATVSTLRSISFPVLRVASRSGDRATVDFQSVAVHTTGTERCTGSATVVRSGSGWLLDRLASTSCTPASSPSAAKEAGKAPQGERKKGGKGHGHGG